MHLPNIRKRTLSVLLVLPSGLTTLFSGCRRDVLWEGQSLNNPYTGILSIFSTRIRQGLSLPIFEDGRESRDFVHIHDVTKAFMSSVEISDSINSIINVGSGIPSSILLVAQNLVKAFSADNVIGKVTSNFRLGDIRHNYADISRLYSILNVVPSITLQQGLNRFAAWVQAQPLPIDQLEVANDELRSRKLMQ